METIVATKAHSFIAIRIAGSRLAMPWPADECFVCLVWDGGGGWSEDAQHLLVCTLLDAGCRYFVCGGRDARRWELAADIAFVDRTLALTDEESQLQHVMTTSHVDESIEEVAQFFVCNTNFDAHSFSRYLVLSVDCDDATHERICAAIREQARSHFQSIND